MDIEIPLINEQLQAGLRGDFARGRELARQLERDTPDCHRAAFNRAWYKMMDGDLLAGFELLDRGRFAGVFGGPPLRTTKPIYRNESLAGQHVLLIGEGGLGDEIINVRFAKDFAENGASVTVACDQSLRHVLARVPGVRSVVSMAEAPHVYHDFWVPLMSAGRVLQMTYPQLSGQPYLSVNPAAREKWRELFAAAFPRPASRPRLGLRFSGNPEFEHEQHRKFPRDLLLKAVGARPWINLQLEETPLKIESWEDTLAILDQLDLVITSCTSVAHASAALGKTTWVIVPVLPYYIWALPGETSPWYESVRLFRQTRFGEWDDVFEAIARALNEWDHA